MPNVGPIDGWRTLVNTFLFRCAPSACDSPTVVVDLPSPRGVGVTPSDQHVVAVRRVLQTLQHGKLDLGLHGAVQLELVVQDPDGARHLSQAQNMFSATWLLHAAARGSGTMGRDGQGAVNVGDMCTSRETSGGYARPRCGGPSRTASTRCPKALATEAGPASASGRSSRAPQRQWW